MNTTLYVGVTNSVEYRSFQHRTGKGGYFTSKYKLTKLVYYEEFDYVNDAIDREKELKGWSRKKKEKLINDDNPLWDDLSKDWQEEDKNPTLHLSFRRAVAIAEVRKNLTYSLIN
jgi:putative endonuclease